MKSKLETGAGIELEEDGTGNVTGLERELHIEIEVLIEKEVHIERDIIALVEIEIIILAKIAITGPIVDISKIVRNLEDRICL